MTDLVAVEELIESKLQIQGPLDLVDLVAEVQLPPEVVQPALNALLEAGRIEMVPEPGVPPSLRAVRRRIPRA